ncbi:tRNA (N(6)-L-threonylcarbamoyladenosine(37)-C(2))-methylthiotransferase MtaB [Terricaulis silvestris]|uniref:Threonylcarbamoyladenosine tRNA methylthiotransferase MtaB n=1 Tax=Terricaulis silvestris TaxID=2686094 RepID=A0A6I6MRV9_9CAUL|nr:tRNA (N(6)-L-threonylcarbamoyladenosine(37)-C(2))-methylthiotransferase MtaB [Terricaulis silvestris]QGZ95364.1 Threonylcarbamoyladenosine tRNA methylthiotransferase MtaB [Terricaulis silvestris]
MNNQVKPPPADVEIVTLGCRLNAYESEAMRLLAGEAGLANAVIFNTCAVTGEAVRQARQAIRRARRERPDANIIVTGCAAQIDPQSFADMPEVSRVIGNAEKMRASSFAPQHERVAVADIMAVRETASHLIDGFHERTRAYVQVQNGCDHRCTFCVIPYGRGNSRSSPAGEVVEQIRRLAANGVPEVVLTGVDLTSWGHDLPGTPQLGSLVARILKLAPDLPMLRLSSIDAAELDDQLFELVTQHDRIAPHLHLSLQHGDDLILKRMKRRHSRAQAIELCGRLKSARPDIALGADLIAGFPTEEEHHFANELSLIGECQLAYVHAFPYSPRPNTPAARMPQVDRAVIKQRAARLREAGDAALGRHLDAWVGKEANALVERDGFARLADFSTAHYGAPASSPASTVNAGEDVGAPYKRLRFTHHDGAHLHGVAA